MFFQQIILLLIAHKYFLLLPIVIVEGPIITVIAGLLSSLGFLNVFIAYAVVVVGDLAGDVLHYALGYYGRQKFIERWGYFFGITMERVKRLEKHFEKHSGKTLILGKLSHGVGAVPLIAAGMAKLPLRKFLTFNFLITLPKSLILLLIGFYFGETYAQISKYLSYTALITLLVTVLLTSIYFAVKKISKKYEEEEETAS